MRKVVLAVLVVLAIGAVAVAQTQPAGFFQPQSLADYSPMNPYMRLRPDIDRATVMDEWFKMQLTADGSLKRPTMITKADLLVLDIFLGDNDLAALWEQIDKYGSITSTLTLSKIKSVSMTNAKSYTSDVENMWCISLSEVLQILTLFNLPHGTYDGTWPERFAEQ